MKLHKTIFIKCIIHEADFSEADLTNSVFDNCDFKDSVFDHTILEKSDFRTSYNFIIDPDSNRIEKAKFSSDNVLGLLTKYNIEIE